METLKLSWPKRKRFGLNASRQLGLSEKGVIGRSLRELSTKHVVVFKFF